MPIACTRHLQRNGIGLRAAEFGDRLSHAVLKYESDLQSVGKLSWNQ